MKKHICIDKIQENSNELSNCTICDTSFENDVKLKSHQCSKVHEGKKSYDCNFCDATFIDSDTLTKHDKLYHEGTQKCDQCGKTYTNKFVLRKHIREIHMDIRKQFQCEYCPLIFNSKVGMKYHISREHENTHRPSVHLL